MIDEYAKLSRKINRQIKKLEKEYPEAVSLERWRNKFKPITSKQPSYNKVAGMLKNARQLVENDKLSLDSQKRAVDSAIETLHRDGYTFITRENFDYFMRFLDDARARGLGSSYSSEQILRPIYRGMKRHKLTDEEIMKNIQLWSENLPRDNEGKVIEVKNPKPLRIRKKRLK